MKATSTKQNIVNSLKSPRQPRNNVTELSVYLAERERQRKELVHSLKGKFSNMKFTSEDLVKQRRAETLLEGR
jgi:hypothetical protein